MSSQPIYPTVTPTSYLTLHYRLSTKKDGDIISTFIGNPATLQMGMGQLAPALEQQLLGLAEGVHVTFELTPLEGFGLRNPDLIQRVSLATLRENSEMGVRYEVGDPVEFNAPSGGRFAGVVLSIEEDVGVFDFNHPLAGQEVVFEVHIMSVL